MATGIKMDAKAGTIITSQIPDTPVDLEAVKQSAVARMKADFRRKFEDPNSELADWRGIRHREQTEGGFLTSMTSEGYAAYVAARKQARVASNMAEERIRAAMSFDEFKAVTW